MSPLKATRCAYTASPLGGSNECFRCNFVFRSAGFGSTLMDAPVSPPTNPNH